MSALTGIGLGAAVVLLFGLLWSIALPSKRVWPPRQSSWLAGLSAWLLTVVVFASAFLAGLGDWNSLAWPAEVRWIVGLPLIIIGNAVVWSGVAQLGLPATSGEKRDLVVDGLYRYSRNPQYMADVAILTGWLMLSGSLAAMPVAIAGIIVLLVAPLAEEPWLAAVYGDAFVNYRRSTRRYI